MKQFALFLILAFSGILCAGEEISQKLAKKFSRLRPIPVQRDMTLSIAVKAGETFRVPLEENPTTGFQWEISQDNPECLEMTRADYLPEQPIPPAKPKEDGHDGKQSTKDGHHDAPQPMLCGAGGMKIFSFKARHSGTATIRFRYRRSWEKDTPPDQEFSMVVFIIED